MNGFGWMEEVGLGAGRGEGCSDFAGDDAGFADAGDEDAAALLDAEIDEVESAVEGGEHGAGGIVEAAGEGGEGGGFDADEGGWGLGGRFVGAVRQGFCGPDVMLAEGGSLS